MINRLRKMLVQEVPEELSVCMFECPETQCTSTMWAECNLRNNDFPERKNAVNFNAHTAYAPQPANLDDNLELPIYT